MDVQELLGRVNELEIENSELKESLQDAAKALREQRALWLQEHAKLMAEIESLKDEVGRLQDTIQEIHQQNQQLENQNQHIYDQIASLQKTHLNMKARLTRRQEEDSLSPLGRSQRRSQRYLKSEEYPIEGQPPYPHPHKTSENIMLSSVPLVQSQSHPPSSAHIEENEYDLKVFLVEDLQGEGPSHFGQDSLQDQRHSLRGSLQAINLIQNYNPVSKDHSQHSSVFTAKYFKYPQEAHPEDPLHIPEQPELQNLQTERCLQPPPASPWWQHAGCFLSGACLGLYLFWQLGE